MRRRYRLLTFKKSQSYLNLRVEWQNRQGSWVGTGVRSYGVDTPVTRAQANEDVQELQRLAGDDLDPLPTGTLSDAVWAGLATAIQDPASAFPFGPLLAARDLIHLGALVIAQGSGNLAQKVEVTQPGMPSSERASFMAWLASHSPSDQAAILAYQWRYRP